MILQAIRKFKNLPLLIVLLAGSWIVTDAVWASSTSRIIPDGRVEAYSGNQVVQVYTQEAPFPEGRMLKTEGRCGVRLDGFYLVADDQSLFGIRQHNGDRVLAIEQGMVYFALSSQPGHLVFQTPAGVFPARQIVIHAAGQGAIKAYLDVQPAQTEIGVLEGGHMVVSTPEGEHKIETGRRITVAQALIFEDEDQGKAAAEQTPEKQPESSDEPQAATETVEKSSRDTRIAWYVGGGLATLAVIGGALALGGGGGGSGGSGGGGGGGGSVSPVD
jgi:hypothetical protein